MHSPPGLTAAVAAAQNLAVRFQGLTFRAIHLRHFPNFAAAQPLFTAPAGAAGSRYVAPNGSAALYVALDPETAYRELNQDFYRTSHSKSGWRLVRSGQLRPVPCVTLGLHLRVSRLLDLTRRHRRGHQSRTRLGISNRSDAELLQPWAGVPNAPTQVLGAEVFSANFFEGIIYPSAQNPKHACLVLFRDRLLATSLIHFLDAATGITGQLP